MAQIKLTVGAANLGRAYPGIAEAYAAIPADVVASGNSYWIAPSKDYVYDVGSTTLTLGYRKTDANHNIRIQPDTGQAFYDDPNILTNPYTLDATRGVTLRTTADYFVMLSVMADYTEIYGLQLDHAGGGNSGAVISVDVGAAHSVIDLCIVKFKPEGNYADALFSQNGGFTVRDTLVILDSPFSQGIYFGNLEAIADGVTIVRPSTYTPTDGTAGIEFWGDGPTVQNTLVINAPFKRGPGTANVARNNGSSSVVGFGTNNQDNLVAANVFANPANDFRTKAGAAIINTGAAPLNTAARAPSGSRQMGTGTDIGAWEYPEAIQAPSATIVDVVVNGNAVTISGTTTGLPDRGVASITHTATPYNDSAVDQGPTNLVLSAGAFSITFSGVHVGEYALHLNVGNSAYPAVDATNASQYTINVPGAQATSVVQDPMDGEVLRIHGTYSGNATSASLIIPAHPTDPQGALDVAGVVTLASGAFTSSTDLPPGRYAAGILRFTTANGTSLAQPGTGPVSVVGIYGNPQAEQGTPDTVAPTMSGAVTFSAITATGYTMAWPAGSDDLGIARYEYSLDGTTFLQAGSGTSRVVTGATAATAYTILLRAVDFGGNVSNTITGTVTTAAAPPVDPPPDTDPPTLLVVDPLLAPVGTVVTGGVRETLVLIDLPAPRSRRILMDHQNRTIRL